MEDSKLIQCSGKQILDSRGTPTIEVEVAAEYGREVFSAKASVPAGKSRGSQEAFEMRDEDGGVVRAIENVEKIIAVELLDKAIDAEAFDHIMLGLDVTRNKTYLGANAMLAVSIAMMRLEAKMRKIPLWKFISQKSGFAIDKPRLYMNSLNGGAHADFCLPFQEYIVAVKCETLEKSNIKALEIFEKIRKVLDEKKVSYYMGDEGGFAPHLETLDEPFQILTDCIASDSDVFIAIDAAASEFYEHDRYTLLGTKYTRGDLFGIYKNLTDKFNLKSIEDPFAENDIVGFEEIIRWNENSILIVGDDLTVTNPILIKKYGERNVASGIIIKPNQIGTVLETLEAIREARKYGWKIIVSHRSGETMDSFIADLAVGVGAFGIKAGAHTQPERKVKYDRLLEIEKEIVVVAEEERLAYEAKEREKNNRAYW